VPRRLLKMVEAGGAGGDWVWLGRVRWDGKGQTHFSFPLSIWSFFPPFLLPTAVDWREISFHQPLAT
jgi:hypothetical protein